MKTITWTSSTVSNGGPYQWIDTTSYQYHRVWQAQMEEEMRKHWESIGSWLIQEHIKLDKNTTVI